MGIAAFSGALPGCTLVGAGAGAAVDWTIPGPYETRAPLREVRLQPHQRIALALRNGRRVEGRYLGIHGPTAKDPESYLILDSRKGIVSVPASELESIGVEVSGKGWLYGGLVGLAIDATIVIAAGIAYSNAEYDWSKSGGGLELGK